MRAVPTPDDLALPAPAQPGLDPVSSTVLISAEPFGGEGAADVAEPADHDAVAAGGERSAVEGIVEQSTARRRKCWTPTRRRWR